MHPVLLRLGFFQLSTYGFFVALAYLTAILWAKSQVPFMPKMTEDKFWILIYGIFFGAIAGGKILYILVDLKYFLNGTLSFFRDFRYGFVFYGGLIGSVVAAWPLMRYLKLPFWETADFFGVALPLGHSVGRLGCFGAGCCYGKPTTMPWGVVFGGSPESVTPVSLWGIPLHPTQLYESACDLAIAIFLMKAVLPKAKNKELVPGTVFLSYIALYAAVRFVIEFFRGDDRGFAFGQLWVSQWIALGCLAAAAGVIWRRGVFRRRS